MRNVGHCTAIRAMESNGDDAGDAGDVGIVGIAPIAIQCPAPIVGAPRVGAPTMIIDAQCVAMRGDVGNAERGGAMRAM